MIRLVMAAYLGALIFVPITGLTIPDSPAGSQEGRASDDGFVSVDTKDLPTISGKSLLVAAYSVILGVLLVYVASLAIRERQVGKAADKLARRLGKTEVSSNSIHSKQKE